MDHVMNSIPETILNHKRSPPRPDSTGWFRSPADCAPHVGHFTVLLRETLPDVAVSFLVMLMLGWHHNKFTLLANVGLGPNHNKVI